MLLTLWRHVTTLGLHYGVNPLVFAVLYLAHHPLFWGTMVWLAARVRAKRPAQGVVTLGVFFWLMPYLYVFAFGRGLPLWVYGLAAVVLAIGGFHAVQEIRRRLQRGTPKASGLTSGTAWPWACRAATETQLPPS